jgi:hypothetical protein
MEEINEIFGKDIGGLIWGYGRPRTMREIEVDIEKIRTDNMCPECKEAIDNKDPDFYVEPNDYACCWDFCWQDYDEDLAYEHRLTKAVAIPVKKVKRRVKKVKRKAVAIP